MTDLSKVKHRNSWMAFASIVIAVIGIFASSPPLAGADEDWHQATAWVLISKGHVSQTWGEVVEGPIPGVLVEPGCFRGNPYQDASCMVPREVDRMVAESPTYNYPPEYYAVVGVGQHVAQWLFGGYEDIGGRLASMLLNLAGITFLALQLRRRYVNWGSYLLVLVTPTVALYWAVVNPNGWEITMALIFTFAFAEVWWRKPGMGPSSTLRELLPLAAISILFALARPAAVVWLVGLVGVIVLLEPSHLSARKRLQALAAAGTGVAAGLAWLLAFPVSLAAAQRTLLPDGPPSPLTYLVWFQQSLNEIFRHLREIFGVFDWGELPVPGFLFLVLLVSWVAFLTLLFTRANVPKRVLVVAFLFAFIIPSVIEAASWNDWPFWYQGRYTIPFIAGFILILLLKYGHLVETPVAVLSLISTLALAYMVWLNTMRFSFGVLNNLPVRFTEPAMGWAPVVEGLLCFALLVILAIIRTNDVRITRRSSPAETG